MKDYLLVILSVVLLAIGFILQKIYQNKTDTSGGSGVDFSIMSAICSIVILIVSSGFSISFTWYSVINSILKSFCGLAYTVIGFKILKEGKVAFYTLFLMSGGMLVPSVWGWLFLGEEPKLLHIIGVIVILAAIILNNFGKERPRFNILMMCIAVFILNGFVSVLAKLHQSNANFKVVPTADYTLLSVVATLIMSSGLKGVLMLNKTNKEKHRKKLNLWPLAIVVIYSMVGLVSSILQLEGAKNLPASMLYPMLTGGTIALTGLFALIFFGEKLSKRNWIAVLLCVLGTCLFV